MLDPTRHDASRRAFLRRATLLTGAPLVLAGCGDWSGSGSPMPMPPRPDLPPAPGGPSQDATPQPRVVDLSPPRAEPDIRVRVQRRGAGEAAPVAVAVAGGGARSWIRVGRADGGGGESAILLVLASPLRVTPAPDGWLVEDATGLRSRVEGIGPIELAVLRGQAPRLVVEGTTLPGVVRLHRRDDGGVDVVNALPMEQYLPGVLARELYPNWRRDTFMAQAIAARSFACVEIAFWREVRHFDVVAGQASQAYVGETGHAPSRDAVLQTRGAVLLWENRLVPGYYSSCCGGVSADARDGISPHPANDCPPLRARPPRSCCDWAPLYSWTSEQGAADAARRVVAWGAERPQWSVPALSAVAALEPVQLNAYGRPVRFRLADGRGASVELPAEHARAALNHPAPSLPALRGPVRSGHFAAVVRSGQLRLDGRGFGHGVGMCQYGAEGMARAGTPWRGIVETYYPGAQVAQVYG